MKAEQGENRFFELLPNRHPGGAAPGTIRWQTRRRGRNMSHATAGAADAHHRHAGHGTGRRNLDGIDCHDGHRHGPLIPGAREFDS